MENKDKKPTWHINIHQNTANILFAENIPTMELAVKIALSIHEASNTQHIVYVMKDDLIEVTFTRYETPANV